MTAFYVVGVVQGVRGVGVPWVSLLQRETNSQKLIADLSAFSSKSFPAQFGDYAQVGYDSVDRGRQSILGEHSRRWRYRFGYREFVLSLDYVYPAFHPLEICYRNQGWKITEYHPAGATKDLPAFKMHMANDKGFYGLVLFNGFDATHAILQHASEESPTLRVYKRLTASSPPISETSWYQLQLFASRRSPVLPDEVRILERIFAEAVAHLRKRLEK